MLKLALIPVLFLIACLFAGFFGALHNQISYTVAPDYFTQFKFRQFRIDTSMPARIGAAIVGWKAAWWMGIVLGLVLIPLGLFIRGYANYFRGMIRVFGVVAATALVVGLAALAYAFVMVDAASVGKITRYGHEINDSVAFARAATMHNYSYFGGLAGIVTGGVAVFWQRWRMNASRTTAPGVPPSS